MTCSHCRFRRTFFALKALPRIKVTKDPTTVEVSRFLHANSESIVKFCVNKLKSEATGNKIEFLNAGNEDVEVLQSGLTEIKCIIASPGGPAKKPDNLVQISQPIISMDPVAKLHDTFFTLAQNIDLAPHLHNRYSHPNQVKLMQYGGSKLVECCKITPSDVRARTVSVPGYVLNEYMNFKHINEKIFKDLFSSLLKQTIQESSNSNTSHLLLYLEKFASECIDSFYRVLEMIKLAASQDAEGNLLSSPYGRFAMSPTSIFLNISISHGLNHAELHNAKLIPVLSILSKFTCYELILSYI